MAKSVERRALFKRAVALLLMVLPAGALAMPAVYEQRLLAELLIVVIGTGMVLTLIPDRPG